LDYIAETSISQRHL